MKKTQIFCGLKLILSKTRLHSSWMRAARALTESPSMLCTGGVSSQGTQTCLVGWDPSVNIKT